MSLRRLAVRPSTTRKQIGCEICKAPVEQGNPAKKLPSGRAAPRFLEPNINTGATHASLPRKMDDSELDQVSAPPIPRLLL